MNSIKNELSNYHRYLISKQLINTCNNCLQRPEQCVHYSHFLHVSLGLTRILPSSPFLGFFVLWVDLTQRRIVSSRLFGISLLVFFRHLLIPQFLFAAQLFPKGWTFLRESRERHGNTMSPVVMAPFLDIKGVWCHPPSRTRSVLYGWYPMMPFHWRQTPWCFWVVG